MINLISQSEGCLSDFILNLVPEIFRTSCTYTRILRSL